MVLASLSAPVTKDAAGEAPLNASAASTWKSAADVRIVLTGGRSARYRCVNSGRRRLGLGGVGHAQEGARQGDQGEDDPQQDDGPVRCVPSPGFPAARLRTGVHGVTYRRVRGLFMRRGRWRRIARTTLVTLPLRARERSTERALQSGGRWAYPPGMAGIGPFSRRLRDRPDDRLPLWPGRSPNGEFVPAAKATRTARSTSSDPAVHR